MTKLKPLPQVHSRISSELRQRALNTASESSKCPGNNNLAKVYEYKL